MIKNIISEYLDKKGVTTKLEHPAIEKFGDYAVRGDVDFSNLEIIEKIDKVAGFSNLWIKENVLVEEAKNILSDGFKNELSGIGKNKTVVIDYSAPNIAKPFGIGHLRSTNIGQAIYNIYQTLGWKCIGVNHLGDWGTQFGKLIVAKKKWWTKDLNDLTIEELEKLYVKFHSESKIDETLIDQGREWFSKLENGDIEAKKIWQICIDISIKEFDRVYKELGVKIDYVFGESFYLDKMDTIIKMLEEKKILVESQGAKIIEFDKLPPAMVIKSNETTTYLTRDLATIKYRVDTWNPDLFIYEVGSDQILHFSQLFATANMLGFKQQFVHVAHGLIRWKDGKFSTRRGDTIHLSEIINKAIEIATHIAPDNDKESIIKVAIGAIKFNDLSSDPKKDVIFDWDRVMSMDGNSAPYLQYTFARANSVLSKSQKTNLPEQLPGGQFPNNEKFDENEKELLRYFYIYEEKIIEAGERYNPAVLAEYLLNLARKYNEFYAKCKIIGEPEENKRIFLTEVTAKIIKDGLKILGIETLEKM